MTIRRFVSIPLASMVALALVASSALGGGPVEISSCGQVVTGKNAALTGDLDCSAYPGTAIVLETRGKLRLNGFTITGNAALPHPDHGSVGAPTVLCEDSCNIIGPGKITNSAGETSQFAACCIFGAVSIQGDAGLLRDVTLEGNHGTALTGPERLRITDCDISNNAGSGVIIGTRTRIKGSTISGNGEGGVWSYSGRGKLKLKDSEVADNGGPGVMNFSKLHLNGVTATGNGSSQAACDRVQTPDGICVDIVVASSDVRGKQITCDDSWARDTGLPIGICAND